MKIAYVTTYDASDVGNWSGLGYYISRALEAQSVEIVRIGPLRSYSSRILRGKQAFYEQIARRRYVAERARRVLTSYADQVARYLSGLDVDAVFSPGTIPISHLRSKIPIVFWTDATCAGMIDFYPGWSDMCRESIGACHLMEQAALSNARLAIYSSEWAARTARENYRVDSSKIKVVPFGANVEPQPDLGDVKAMIERRCTDVCKLLFMGVDWHRKGGAIAVDLAKSLNTRGLKTELTVVGCGTVDPLPDYVKVEGFVSKKTKEGRDRIARLFAESHFLVLPSRADCVPVVIAESNSFGVPVVTSNVGGIRTAVKDRVNGYALPLSNFVTLASGAILESMENPAAYDTLALSAFGQYESRLNWQVAGRKVKALLKQALGLTR